MAKTAKPVDKKLFKDTMESITDAASVGAYWEAVVAAYNKVKALEPITVSIAKLRAAEWNISCPIEGKRGRPAGAGRAAKEVDRKLIEKCLAKVEKNGPLPNLGALWESIAEAYNAATKDEKEHISFATVMNRVSEWGLTYKTVAAKKGKPTKNIDKEVLQGVIDEVEKKNTFANLGQLWLAVADAYEKKVNDKISTATVVNRVNEWGLTFKTEMGKRGKHREVDKDAFLAAVAEVEKNGPLENHGVLWEAIAAKYSETNEEISAAIAAARVKEWGLFDKLKTEPGRRTNPDGAVSKPKGEFDRPLRASGVPACLIGQGQRAVAIPAGEPYVKLKGTSEEEVVAWAEATVEAAEKQNLIFAGSALLFWVNKFYQHGSPEHTEVCGIINRWNYDRFAGYLALPDTVDEVEGESESESEE